VQIFGTKLKRNLAPKICTKNVDEIDTWFAEDYLM
jgi:hypothetical protein